MKRFIVPVLAVLLLQTVGSTVGNIVSAVTFQDQTQAQGQRHHFTKAELEQMAVEGTDPSNMAVSG